MTAKVATAAAEEAIVATEAKEAIVAAEAEEAIEDKDISSHRSIGAATKMKAPAAVSRSVSGNDSGGGFGEVATVAAPARRWGSGWKIPVNSGFTKKIEP